MAGCLLRRQVQQSAAHGTGRTSPGRRAEVFMGERPREVEIKLDIPAARIPGLKRQLSRVERLKGQRRSEILESTYFDTARLDLRDAGLTLRVRRVGDLWI